MPGRTSGTPPGSGVEPGSTGRRRDLDELLAALDDAQGGSGSACVVVGEAGIGKTRLVEDVLDRARSGPWTVLSGRAHDYDRGQAYATWRDVLAAPSGGGLDPRARADASDLLAVLDVGPPSCARAAGFVRDLATRVPTVVAVDDAHLADEESLTALALAARHVGVLPLLLLFTVRRDHWGLGTAVAATVGRMVEWPGGHIVDLGPLGGEDMEAVVRTTLGGPADPALVSYVLAFSRGNPLFGREVLLALREQGGIRAEQGRFYLTGEPVTGTGSRRTALLQRVFLQDADARQLARVLAALRRVHLDHLGTLSDVTGLDAARLQVAFDGLTRASIIESSSTGWYEFTHPLLADVLYEDLGPLERRRLHRLVSDRFDGDGADGGLNPLERARHLTEAAGPGDADALAAAVAAAELTSDRAPLSAAHWFERAIDLLPAHSERRSALAAERAQALWRASRVQAAVEAGTDALTDLPAGGLRARTAGIVVDCLYGMGRYDEALELVTAELDRAPDPAPFLARRAMLCSHLGRATSALQGRDEARAAVSASALEDAITTDVYLAHLDELLGGGDTSERAQRLAALAGPGSVVDPLLRLPALEAAAYVTAHLGHVHRATALLEESTAIFERIGWRDVGGQYVFASAFCQYQSGEWHQALETIRAGAVHLEFAGLANNLAWLRLLEARILTAQGRFDEASAVVDNPGYALDCLIYRSSRELSRANVALWRGELDLAADVVSAQTDVLEEACLVHPLWEAAALAVQIHLEREDEGSARRAVEQLGLLARSSPRPAISRALDLASASALGDVGSARRALASARHDGSSVDEAAARLALARLGDDPAEHLEGALSLYAAMDALVHTRRVAAAAKALGMGIATAERSGDRQPAERGSGDGAVSSGASLTTTERDLVRLLAQGLSNREISTVLHYSPKTVEIYLSRLYRKLGCSSRFEVIAAYNRGAWPDAGATGDDR